MKSAELLREIESIARSRGDLACERHPLAYRCGRFDLLRVASSEIARTDKVLFVLSGLHGDERAGPLSILKFLDEITQRAHTLGVKLVVYPLANPSGFDAGTRYNGDHDSGAEGNGDFLRDVDGGWRWSIDVDDRLPVETVALGRLLKEREPRAQIRAVLDLHQDCLTSDLGAAAYHYAFGDLGAYQTIVDELRAVVPVLANTEIGAGFGVQIDERGNVVRATGDEAPPRTDENGFIVRHDGSIVDLAFREGVPFAVAAETTGATPIDVACEVNRRWLHGLLRAIA